MIMILPGIIIIVIQILMTTLILIIIGIIIKILPGSITMKMKIMTILPGIIDLNNNELF